MSIDRFVNPVHGVVLTHNDGDEQALLLAKTVQKIEPRVILFPVMGYGRPELCIGGETFVKGVELVHELVIARAEAFKGDVSLLQQFVEKYEKTHCFD